MTKANNDRYTIVNGMAIRKLESLNKRIMLYKKGVVRSNRTTVFLPVMGMDISLGILEDSIIFRMTKKVIPPEKTYKIKILNNLLFAVAKIHNG